MSTVNGRNVTVEGDLTEDHAEFGHQFDRTTPKVIIRDDAGKRSVVVKTAVK